MLKRAIAYTSQKLCWKNKKLTVNAREDRRIDMRRARSVLRSRNTFDSRIGHVSPPGSIATSFDRPYFLRGHLPEIGGIWLLAGDLDWLNNERQKYNERLWERVWFFSCRFNSNASQCSEVERISAEISATLQTITLYDEYILYFKNYLLMKSC